MKECPLCKIKEKEKELIIYEDEHSLAVTIIEPLIEGHILVLPKRHVKELEELSEEEMVSFIKSVTKVVHMLKKTYDTPAAFSYMKHGKAKSQEHLHIHILPGFVPIRTLISSHFRTKPRERKSFEELRKVAEKIKTME